MKKKGISPEYIYKSIPGSFNMVEHRSFFGSKMMYIDDSIVLDKRDIVYYQQATGEQLDLTQELNLDSNLYSISQDKLDNLEFGFDINQSEDDKNNKTKWVLELNLRQILKNYIYANIKNNRTFESIQNKDTQTRSVNESINKYIDNNIIDRYQYLSIDFFIKYLSLNENNIDRFKTNYDSNIELEENKFSNIRIVFTEDKSMVRIFFTQQQDSKEFTFNYYFNVNFEKK
tara:strand:+ start:45580 stop:46269 length:690 start_codon:yes stop_codon:yes gene_type:complete